VYVNIIISYCHAQIRENTSNEQMQYIIDTCHQAVTANHGVSLHAIVLLKQKSIPKTTSGKVARAWCKKAYSEGTLFVEKKWENSDVTAATIDTDLYEDNNTNEGNKEMMVSNECKTDEKGDAVNENEDDESKGGESTRLVAPFTANDLHNMTLEELENMLESKLLQISGSGPGCELKAPIDRDVSLMNMGLDSMTIVQFKGVLENR
jgi:hypothetical protein